MSSQEVRVRIAPSPTGDWHLGNARTALFSYLFARHHGGKFFLRIEDTDRSRLVEGAVERLLDLLDWLNLTPDLYDEQPFIRQSDRLDLYKEAAEKLVAEGLAYYCFATPEELEAMRTEQEEQKLPPRYDNRWGYRDLSLAEAQQRVDAGEPHVIRFKMPQTGETVVTDLIRGEIRFANALTDDFVILKADGYPTYHLAHIVDDHLMNISHVTRGDEWISSIPKHVQLHDALGWELPQYMHFPVILGPDKGKLSKRHGAEPVYAYRDNGYLPEALINFLARLGWSSGTDQEIFSREELIALFDVSRLQKNPAVFDLQKLDWYNATYIRQLDPESLRLKLINYYEYHGGPIWHNRLIQDKARMLRILPVIQERMTRLADLPECASVFYNDLSAYDPHLLVAKKQTPQEARRALEIARDAVRHASSWQREPLETALRNAAAAHDLSAGAILWPVRAALTGLSASPGAFEMLDLLGLDESLARIDKAIDSLSSL